MKKEFLEELQMKRFTAGLLAAIMLILLLPSGIFAATSEKIDISVKDNLAYGKITSAAVSAALNGGCSNFDFSKDNTKGINAVISLGLSNSLIINHNSISVAVNKSFADSSLKELDLKIFESTKTLPESVEKVNGTKPVIEISAKTSDKELSYFNESLSVTVPYEATEKEKDNIRALTVWAMDETGVITPVMDAQYDDMEKTITFKAKICGTYAVVYNIPEFEDNKDEPANYAYDFINFLAQKGAIKGTSDTEFEPFNEIIRGDVILLVMRATGIYGEKGEYFSDTPENMYYSSTIAMARELGIAKGISEDEFGPQNKITRQDFFTSISRALDIAYPGVYTNINTDCLKEYSDFENVSDYAKEHIAKLMNYGIVSGNDGRILPKDNITRREVATVFAKLYKRFDNGKSNLSLGGKYYISYPGPSYFSGDPTLKSLTDGKKGGEEITGENGWLIANIANTKTLINSSLGRVYLNSFESPMEPHAYIKHDFMTLSDVTAVEMNFGADTDKNIKIPQKVEFIFSNDGVNFTVPGGEAKIVKGTDDTAVYRLDLENPVMAKAVKAIFYSADGSSVAMDEIKVIGTRRYEVKKVTKDDGVTYDWNGNISASAQPVENQLLLDGEYYQFGEETSEKYHTATTINNVIDPVTETKSQIITFDFGKEVNIAQIDLAFLSVGSSRNSDYVVAMYGSSDVVELADDFGQSYLASEAKKDGETKYYYTISRNNTVKTRYLFLILENAGRTSLDEIDIYTTDTPQAEPDYGWENYDTMLANTNILENKTIKVNGQDNTFLTDTYFQASASKTFSSNKEIVVTGELDQKYDKLVGTEFYFLTDLLSDSKAGAPAKIETYLSDDGKNYTLVSSDIRTVKTGKNHKVNQFFNNASGKYFKMVITPAAGDTLKLSEIQLYSEQSHLPLIRGGFFQLGYNQGSSWAPMEKNTEMAWYNQLKGMKEMGMDYVVMQYGVDYATMHSVIPSQKLTDLGYKYYEPFGSYDPLEAVLKAAEKLGMKVYLGTIHSYGNYNEIIKAGALNFLKKEAEDGKVVMDVLMENYGKYKSFEGFYLADETCDAWLSQGSPTGGGVSDYRYLYKTQSDYAHEKYPEKKLMTAPAIWRSSGYVASEKNLYNLIKPEVEGERAVVDIVAAQDCLGRDNAFTLAGTSIQFKRSMYQEFEPHIEAWARGIKKAGAQFWNDTEVFNGAVYHTKEFTDIIESIEFESKYTNGTIVFDIPTTLSPLTQKTYNGLKSFYMEYFTAEYTKHYSKLKDWNYQNGQN